MNDHFLLAPPAAIAHLQLNRPERSNTMAPGFFTALRDAVRALTNDGGTTRVLVISSSGPHFSAGLSLDVFAGAEISAPAQAAATTPKADRRDPRESASREAIGAILKMLGERRARASLDPQDTLRRLLDCFNVLDEAPFPTICAVQGGCIGAGLDLACACDIRLCSADAFFTPDEGDLGMTADLGVLQRLRHIIPQGALHELAYTGERLGAARARELGLVNAVLPDAAALLNHALALAARIAAKSPPTTAGTKAVLRAPRRAN